MLVIPFEVRGIDRGPLVVVMIMAKENLDRMRQGDPFDLKFADWSLGMPVDWPIRQLDLVIAYEEDTNKILEFRDKNDIIGLMTWLERGRKILPGDVTLRR